MYPRGEDGFGGFTSPSNNSSSTTNETQNNGILGSGPGTRPKLESRDKKKSAIRPPPKFMSLDFPQSVSEMEDNLGSHNSGLFMPVSIGFRDGIDAGGEKNRSNEALHLLPNWPNSTIERSRKKSPKAKKNRTFRNSLPETSLPLNEMALFQHTSEMNLGQHQKNYQKQADQYQKELQNRILQMPNLPQQKGHFQDLKHKVRDLKHLISSAEGSMNVQPLSMNDDHLMREMQEQVKLQKELHLRRKELENLMKKDILDNLKKNNSRQLNLSDDKSDISIRSSSIEWPMDSEVHRPVPRDPQLVSLQNHIEIMHQEIREIHSSLSNSHQQGPQHVSHSGLPSMENSNFHSPISDESLSRHQIAFYYHQHQQIQMLTNSVNQCYQMLIAVQRDVTSLQRDLEKLQRDSIVNNTNTNGPTLSNSNSHRSENNSQEWRSHQGLERTSNDWNASDGGTAWQFPNTLNLNAVNASETSALNNQVPPGMRANNYWDNFRSFSHQNHFSAANPNPHVPPASPTLATIVPITGAPNVAQVTPRQIQSSTLASGSSFSVSETAGMSMENNRNAGNNSTSIPMTRQAFVEPNFSSINNSPSARPKRKQKINREQNRENNSVTLNTSLMGNHGAIGALVLPMPQNQEVDRNVNNASHLSSQERPIVNSLTRSIYNQVNNLISQHEERPDHLAKIFQDLQSINQRLVDPNESQESQSREETANSLNPLYFQMGNLTLANSSHQQKPKEVKRLLPFPKVEPNLPREEREEEAESENTIQNSQANFATIRNSFFNSDGLPGNEVPETASGTIPKNFVANDSQIKSAETQSGPQSIKDSDERESEIPEADQSLSPNADKSESVQGHFIDGAMALPMIQGQNETAENSLFTPFHIRNNDGISLTSFHSKDMDLDEFPTRLSSGVLACHQLEQQMREEEASMKSLIDEVLDSGDESQDDENEEIKNTF